MTDAKPKDGERRQGETRPAPYALVVDDHPLVARGIAHYLMTHCGFAAAPIATDSDGCLRQVLTYGTPTLAVIDFWLADDVAVELLEQLAACCPTTRLLVVSGDHDHTLCIQRKVQAAGAHGFLQKNEKPEVFAQAVAALLEGNTWFTQIDDNEVVTPLLATSRSLSVSAQELGLTQRQGQVLSLMLRGMPNKQIAQVMAVSEHTVKEHVTSILGKLGVSNRVQVIALLHGRQIET